VGIPHRHIAVNLDMQVEMHVIEPAAGANLVATFYAVYSENDGFNFLRIGYSNGIA
jgi:hypothetical protein